MCEIELSDRVEICRSYRSRRGDSERYTIFLYFSYTFCEELTIPLPEIFEVFREEEVFEDIASLPVFICECRCDYLRRMTALTLEVRNCSIGSLF